MKAESTRFHSIISGREECSGLFRVGKYRMRQYLGMYKLNGVWRLVKNDKVVEIASN